MVRQDIAARVGILLSNAGAQALRLVTLAALALVLVAPPARADISAPLPSAKSDVNESSGAFSESIPIQVPAFHGIEPKLALSYSSSGGNGFVGVGWDVNGDSFIERTSPGGGAPRYDASDVFVLDGAELVTCTTFSGTHCPKHQSYQRIVYIPASYSNSGEWNVFDKDGTRRNYVPLYVSGTKTFRWALKTVTDSDGNRVTYDYDYAGTTDINALLKTISYNGAVITFHSEARTDPSNFATSWGLSANVKRLKTISVKVGTSYTRAYALTYETSPGTNRSRLKTVREVGRPDSVDAAGTITGGLSLPNPITLSYQDNNGIFGLAADGWAGNTAGLADGTIDWNGNYVSVYTGDFNGDGKTDILRQERGPLGDTRANNIRVYLANSDGSFTLAPTDANGNASGLNEAGLNVGWHGDRVDITLGDFNGDGKTDLLRVEKNGYGSDNGWNVMLFYASASNNGTFREGAGDGNANVPGLVPTNWPGSTWNGDLVDVQTGDFNGDGKLDIVRLETGAWADNRTNNIMIFMNNGNETFSLATTDANGNALGLNEAGLNVNGTGPGWSTKNVNIFMSDMNGDGKTDIVRVEKSNHSNTYTDNGITYFGNNLYNIMIFYASASGNGTFIEGALDGEGNTVGLGGAWQPYYVNIHFGDFNGDGKTDILRQEKGAWATNGDTRGVVEVFLNVGDGSFRLGPPGWAYGALGLTSGDIDWNGDYTNLQVSDFNGDGKADVLRQEKSALGGDGANTVRIYFSNGDGSFRLPTLGWAGNVAGLADGNIDWNGDHAMIQLADFNGDGNLDVFRHEYNALGGDGSNTVRTYLQPATAPDLLTSVNNGIDGITDIAYVPSTYWVNASWPTLYLPVGTISQTVASITVKDGRGLIDTTTYSYYQANWSNVLRRPLGFRITQTRPSDGSYINTTHRQTDASPGVVSQVDTYSSADKLLHSNIKTFSETTTPPYVSLVTREETTENNGSTVFRTTRKDYDYTGNSYGDPTKIIDWGDIGLSTDDTTSTRSYLSNSTTTTYMVSQVSEEKTFPGNNVTTGTPLTHSRHYYDGATLLATLPTKGNVTKTEQWNNVSNTWIANTFGYDGYGNKIRTTDPENRVSTIAFNDPVTPVNTAYPNVYPVKSCQVMTAAGVTPVVEQCTTTIWDVVLGLPLDVKDPNNAVTRTGYDKLGRKTSQTDAGLNVPGPNVTTWTYNVSSPGMYIQEIQPDGSPIDGHGITGRWSNTHIDGLGRVWLVQKEGLTTSTYSQQQTLYNDASSQVWKRSHWYVNGATPLYTVFAYDSLDRILTVTAPDGSTVETQYKNDASGKPYVRRLGEMGQETLTWNDTDGHAIKIQEKYGEETGGTTARLGTSALLMAASTIPPPPGMKVVPLYYTTTFEYDLLGHKVKAIDHNGNEAWRATYNSLGHKLTEYDPNRGTWSYTYYKDGKVNTETDGKGQVTTLTYDMAGRIKTKVVGGETTTWYYDEPGYGYSIGRVTRVVYPGGSKANTYDDIRGLLTLTRTCIDTICKDLRTSHDSVSRPRTITYPDTEVVTYSYDAAGNLYSVSNYVSAMTWNPAGKLLTMAYAANGTTNTYDYDPNREWLNTATATKGTVMLYTSSYGYDRSARVISMTQGTPTAVSTTYTYDFMDRLKEIKNASGVVTQSFTYNGIGNITWNSLIGAYSYHATKKHAVTQAGANAYTYDDNGSMLTGAGNTLTWDAENRVASITRTGVTTTFAYDEEEQRVKKTTGSVSTLYFSKLIEVTGTTNVQYYYAGAILVAKKDGTTKNWYHADRLGSTRVMTDVNGNEAKDYDYQAFGASTSTGTARNERGYTGHITDAETGLIYMGARYYDATLSRFVSADSIIGHEDLPQDLNRYTYANNNPINNTDPDGHCWGPAAGWMGACISALVGGLAGGAAAAINYKGALKEIAIAAAEGALSGFIGGGVMKGLKAVLGSSRVGMSTQKVRRVVALNAPWIYGISLAGTRAGIDGARRDRAIKSSRELSAFVAGLTGATGRLYGVTYKTMHVGTYMDAIKHGAKYGEGVLKSIRGPAAKAFIAGLTARVAADQERKRRRDAIQKRKRECVALGSDEKRCVKKGD